MKCKKRQIEPYYNSSSRNNNNMSNMQNSQLDHPCEAISLISKNSQFHVTQKN